jgi:hypothetical protein
MVRIDITPAAFEAISKTLPVSVGFEREPDAKGQRHVWTAPASSTSSPPCADPARASPT